MKPACRRLIAALAMLCCTPLWAASYPSESQLRTAIEAGAGVLKGEGMEIQMHDAQQEGLSLSLVAAGLNLDTGVCLVFYNTKPAEGLSRFFAGLDEKDMPLWLNAIAVHEATHCVEQREAYLRQHFDKVLPPKFERDHVTVKGYLSMVKSGDLETWGEALADIASVLYLKEVAPERWTYFAQGFAALRHDLAGTRPEHDTSLWLRQLIAANDDPLPDPNIFEAAFQLRRKFQPE